MDVTDLQARLAQLDHLLPSQRECLERLLFQLAFNDHQHINVLGSLGSGKSTLALSAAELLSAQYNIALLDTSVNTDSATEQLMQQWFARPGDSALSITEQVVVNDDQQPLAVVIDDAERFSADFIQQLSALPSLVLCFSAERSAEAGVTLTLNRITIDDAEQLLRNETLNSIELAERLANANGNLHQLLLPVEPVSNTEIPGVAADKPLQLKYWTLYASVAAVVLLILLFVLWPEQKQLPVAVRIPVQSQPASALPDTLPSTTIDIAADNSDAADTLVQSSEQLQTEVSSEIATRDDTEVTVAVEEDTTADSIATPTAESEVIPEATSAEPVSTNSGNSAQPVFGYDESQLLSLQKSEVALQLAVLSSDAALTRFKRTYPALDILIYQRNWQGQMQLVLVLAPFASTSEAKVAMSALPAALRASGPFTKAVKTIHSEINARQVSLHSDQQE